MTDTVMLDSRIVEEIETKKKLISLQNDKRNLICPITDDARYLHSLLTEKDPNTIAEINAIITQIEAKIEKQTEEINQSRKNGIKIPQRVSTALANEHTVCEEIHKKLNNIPALIERIDELERKIARTMVEIRAIEI